MLARLNAVEECEAASVTAAETGREFDIVRIPEVGMELGINNKGATDVEAEFGSMRVSESWGKISEPKVALTCKILLWEGNFGEEFEV